MPRKWKSLAIAAVCGAVIEIAVEWVGVPVYRNWQAVKAFKDLCHGEIYGTFDLIAGKAHLVGCDPSKKKQ